MKKHRTADRILSIALMLFNDVGESNIATNRIADEMDISPGNLHYHFRTKADIVEALFERCDTEVSDLLAASDPGEADVERAWLQIHLLFETMWAYRFVYRDIAQLVSKYPSIERKTARLMHRKISLLHQVCTTFEVDEKRGEPDTIARNMALVLTYWLNFELACGVEGSDSERFARGAYQVMSLLLPYLDEESQTIVHRMAGAYT